MNFCGHCGLLQPPDVRVCPRCGMAVTPDGGAEGQIANDNTIISTPDKTELSRGAASNTQTDLMQGPTQFSGYNSQTQGIEQGNNTPIPPYGQHTSFPGYYVQNFIPPPPPVPLSHSGSEFPTTERGPYPGPVFPTGQGPMPPPILPQKTKSNAAVWVMVLILFLVVATVSATTAVFVIGPSRVAQIVRGGGVATQPTAIPSTSQASTPVLPTPTPQVPTPSPTVAPEQQAQSVIANYFSAINSKDYQTAYNLWVNYPDSYQNFANGFSDTQRDDYQFGQVLQQGDGTVQVNITLVATSTSSQQTTYQGYYIVGPQSDGSWKIVKASLHQV